MIKRINISFPEETLSELKELIPARKRSNIINEALTEKLKEIRKDRAFAALKKARENFISFESIKDKKDAVAFVNSLRKKADRRNAFNKV